MATGIEIRFVRCPRCRETLPVPPDHPLYRCGNCDTIIQAKSRRTRCVDLESDLVKTNVQGGSVLEVKEAKRSQDKDQLGNSEETTSMSEEMLTSPDIACLAKHPSSVVDDESIKAKGKNKLIVEDQDEDFHGVCEAKNLLGIKKQESSLFLLENQKANQDRVTNFVMDGASTSDPVVPSDSSLSDSHISLYLTSPDHEYPDFDAPSFRRNGMLETYASSAVTDFRSETDWKPKGISNYLASRSYYAYDGSESSYDGIDDRRFNKFTHPLRKAKGLDYMSNEERLSEAEFKVNACVGGRLQPGDDPMKSWSPEKYSDMKRCTVGYGLRPEKMRNITKSLFASGDALPTNSTLHAFNSSEKQNDSKSDKLDLLRTVWELKDQLDKMHFSKPQINARFPVQEENFSGYLKHHHLSRNAFSREFARCGNQLPCSCLHCYPRDLNCSAELSLHHKNSHHFEKNFCDISLSSARQQHHTRKSFSKWDVGKNPAKEMKLKNVMKQILPVSGGAPFIACHYCWKLLQIPTELFISRRRYHKLMCGACKKIMRFSLQKGVHLAQHTPEIAVFPGEADGAGSHRNLCLDSCQNVELQSSQNTDELSPRRSGSLARNNSHSKETASGVSSEVIEDEKKKSFCNKSQYKKDNLMEQANSVPSSEKFSRRTKTSESKEEATSPNSSPLHHLMGYSSVSQVFRS